MTEKEINEKTELLYDRMFRTYISNKQYEKFTKEGWGEICIGSGNEEKIRSLLSEGYTVRTGNIPSPKVRNCHEHCIFYKQKRKINKKGD